MDNWRMLFRAESVDYENAWRLTITNAHDNARMWVEIPCALDKPEPTLRAAQDLRLLANWLESEAHRISAEGFTP